LHGIKAGLTFGPGITFEFILFHYWCLCPRDGINHNTR
jgi:hypothetical protein